MGGNDTTIGVSFELRDKLKSMKIIEDETYPNVIRRIIEQAEKVPKLEAESSHLWYENEQLKKELEDCEKLIREDREMRG